ncbi:splicing factor U2af large subunit B isoform X2 [Beta vulgaris subsp. vulgaris]|uniref:splicing factor U2af large subunit B isoform X2 n=1 Tax=Beta vulgaris subsp. vulgaris TaxID=3555 RepID=UPI002037529B|nr:splicing factor U2af large subunit B isoform X2 [Beta vulgaris subsp. vulgaris]
MTDYDFRSEDMSTDHAKSSPRRGSDDRSSRSKHKSRELDQEMPRSRDREREHHRGRDRRDDRDRDSHRRDYRDRNGRDERRRDHGGRDYDRSYDREKRHRARSRSRSPSHSKSKRTSGFDMAPPEANFMSSTPVQGSQDQLPGVPQPVPGLSQSMFTGGPAQLGTMSLMPAQFMTQQATRHARRVYVGGLPPSANEQTIATFFSQVMTAIGGNAAGPGDAVVNVYINHEKKFAFVEMRSVEEASNAMALDGISFEGVSVRVKRPTDYNPALAAALGPSLPSPHLNLAAVGLVPGAVAGTEGPDRIFVGGIPYYFNEVQMRELLQSFGPLKAFDLVKDRDTGNSKGYGFCVYQDAAVTDIACDALNGLKMGDKTLTVRRAAVSGQAKLEHENLLAHAQQHVAMQKMAFEAGGFNLLGVTLPTSTTTEIPTKILCLNQVVNIDELRDDNEYEEIVEDMRDECGKFGVLLSVIIPRPNMEGNLLPGVGKVFLEYADTVACANAKNMLGGRKFGGNTVTADYYPEDKFYSADYSG